MGNVFSFISKKMSSEEDEYEFPKTLEEFGYHFNEEGQLRNIDTDNGFNFVEKEDNHRFNQKRYEAIGDIITDYIYDLLEKQGLKRVSIPVDATSEEPTSFFFQTEDAQSNTEKLLILIHGSGPVKAGQWARRLIMNDCLDSGTQLPYIKWGMENGYGIIVANTNINSVKVGKNRRRIRGSESPEDHMDYLWNHFVKPSKAKNIAIVAHSYGGVSTLYLVNKYLDQFRERVFAMAFTDSVHSFSHQDDTTEESIDFFKERAVNWASAYDPLDTVLKTSIDYTPTVSAGTDKHEYTSYSSMKSIFKWFTKKYAEHTGTLDVHDVNRTDSHSEETSMSQDNTNDLPMSQETEAQQDPEEKETQQDPKETETHQTHEETVTHQAHGETETHQAHGKTEPHQISDPQSEVKDVPMSQDTQDDTSRGKENQVNSEL